MDLSQRIAVCVEPLDGFLETLAQVMSGLKPEEFLGPADIQAPSRLPVGLGGVPCDQAVREGDRKEYRVTGTGSYLPLLPETLAPFNSTQENCSVVVGVPNGI